MTTAAAPPDADGWCSLSLHAGASIPGAAPRRRGPRRASASSRSRSASRPRSGCRPITPTRCTSTRSTCSSSPTRPRSRSRTRRRPTPTARSPSTPPSFIPEGATLQTGIGSVPSTLVKLLAEGDGGDYGIHSEMFTTGLDAPPRGRQGHEPQGPVRRRLGGHLRGRHGASSTRGSTETRTSPSCRSRSSTPRADRPQPADDRRSTARCGRHPGPGRRRHDRRQPVLGHRRPRGLHLGPGAVARGAGAALPSLDGDDQRRASVANRAVVRRRRRDHDSRATRST